LDKQGIAVRTGHHCTQPLMDFYKIPGTIRASFAFYNTKEEIDFFISAVEKSINMLR
jgi:cysteine desulfurase/selenocysteine lyase